MAKEKNIVVGLDVGTTKICCVVAEIVEGELEIIGLGTHPSRGLRKGVVVNIEATLVLLGAILKDLTVMVSSLLKAAKWASMMWIEWWRRPKQ